MINPPIAPDTRIGTIAFVMMASGRLKRIPRSNPTIQPGQGANVTDHEPKAEACNERAKKGGSLIGKTERNHHRGIETAEDQAANYAKIDS